MPTYPHPQPTTWDANERAVRLAWEQSRDGLESARRAAFTEARAATFYREEMTGHDERVAAQVNEQADSFGRFCGDAAVGVEFGHSIRQRVRDADTALAKRRAKARAELLASRMDFNIHAEAAE